jgi:hypothetical protein
VSFSCFPERPRLRCDGAKAESGYATRSSTDTEIPVAHAACRPSQPTPRRPFVPPRHSGYASPLGGPSE